MELHERSEYYVFHKCNVQFSVCQSQLLQSAARFDPYNSWQDSEVIKAAHAMSDLCNAVKKMDEQHQQEAFFACLEVMAKEFQWRAD